MPGKKTALTDPHIVELPAQTMAVVRTMGDPNTVLAESGAMSALYGAVYALKFALKKQGVAYKVGPLYGRWPDAHLKPKDEWTGIWAIQIPEGTSELVQKDVNVPVAIERWDYGTTAEIMHIGSYASEGPTVQRLHEFIEANGYVICGVHEEVYLTSPRATVQKTLIRYAVRRT